MFVKCAIRLSDKERVHYDLRESTRRDLYFCSEADNRQKRFTEKCNSFFYAGYNTYINRVSASMEWNTDLGSGMDIIF